MLSFAPMAYIFGAIAGGEKFTVSCARVAPAKSKRAAAVLNVLMNCFTILNGLGFLPQQS